METIHLVSLYCRPGGNRVYCGVYSLYADRLKKRKVTLQMGRNTGELTQGEDSERGQRKSGVGTWVGNIVSGPKLARYGIAWFGPQPTVRKKGMEGAQNKMKERFHTISSPQIPLTLPMVGTGLHLKGIPFLFQYGGQIK